MEKLNSIFFYHLEKAIKTYRQLAQNQLRDEGFDITIDQWLVLKAITDNPDVTQNELAEIVFKDKASVTRIIALLATHKYLKSEVLKQNRRRTKLSISAKGLRIIHDILPVVRRNRKMALRGLKQEDIQIAEKVLRKIAENCTG